MKYQSYSAHCSKVISKVKVFNKKMGQTPRSRSQGKNGTTGMILSQGILNQNSSTHCSKVISKVQDRMIDRTKTICPPIFDLGGIITNHIS